MIMLIIEFIFWSVGMIAVILGVKNNNPIMLGEGLFLLYGTLFYELLLLRRKMEDKKK